ncbi:MAG: GyrI-like domain-containing protein [Bacilli bacterium]
MEYVIETLKPQSIAFMRRIGPYGRENYELMKKLKDWANQNNLLQEGIIYGIAHDGSMTPPEKRRYDVGIVIDDLSRLSPEVELGAILPGRYAVFMISHTQEAVSSFWSTVFQELPVNNLTFDYTKPILERYKAKLVELGLCEMCVPIR